MKKLAAAQVFRSGRTARTWNHETDKVELGTGANGLEVRFSLSSKGGGITEVQVTIGSEDFAVLTAAMTSADRVSATREMAATLASEMARQTEYEKETIQKVPVHSASGISGSAQRGRSSYRSGGESWKRRRGMGSSQDPSRVSWYWAPWLLLPPG